VFWEEGRGGSILNFLFGSIFERGMGTKSLINSFIAPLKLMTF